MTPGDDRAGGWMRAWRGRDAAALLVGLLVAVAVRVPLLPTDGLRGDIDQFVAWTHGLTTIPFGNAYDQELTFGPVMVYIWGALAAIEPGFRTAVDASDPWIRVLMKVPASLADIGLALGVGHLLRERPRLAIAGVWIVALHPAVIDVSAWWGQYESIYVLAALAAVVFAVGGRDGLAAAALAVAVATKPQALPFLVPFAAWFWARGGAPSLVRAGLVGGGVTALLWAPFIAAGGPAAYLGHLGRYQDEVFAILSLRAWNAWWLVQEAGAGGSFASDQTAILGPIAFRQIGYAVAGVLMLIVARAVARDARPLTLVLGLAASTLVAFSFLTTMHERYAYAAVAFFVLLIAEPRARWLGVAFGVVFTLNLLAAVPPTDSVGDLLPVAGPLGIAGSIAMLAITVATLRLLQRPASTPPVGEQPSGAGSASPGRDGSTPANSPLEAAG